MCRCLGLRRRNCLRERNVLRLEEVEVVMKSTQQWGQHLRELMNASMDPTVYALQWAHDPRCIQLGQKHRRVGAPIERNAPVCRLWLGRQRGWS